MGDVNAAAETPLRQAKYEVVFRVQFRAVNAREARKVAGDLGDRIEEHVAVTDCEDSPLKVQVGRGR